MTRYVICAKETYSGTSESDIASPLQVTEIATELIITRLYCMMMLNDNKISSKDTIITTSERKCLYENIFDNVIEWNEFIKLNTSEDEVIDLLEHDMFERLAGGEVKDRLIPYLPFYQNWNRDKHNLQNINFNSLKEYNVSDEFVCLVIRTRGAWPEKNLSPAYWKKLISCLEEEGIKVFIFGKETEEYATSETEHVKDFRDWCSLVNHTNCKHIISTITGGVYPAFICGRENIKLTIVDNLNLVPKFGYDPIWYNDCINFTSVNKNIINHLPSIDELTDIIINENK